MKYELLKFLKKIIFYPLLKIGGVSVSIFSILKFLLIISIGIFILKFLNRRIKKFFSNKLPLPEHTINTIVTIFYYSLLVILFIVALSTVGINLTQIGFLLGALGVGIGFGLQSIFSNFISGIILLLEGSLKVGDLVELEDGVLGVVKKIAMRSTIIRTFDGKDVIVPNSEFITKRISTWTYEDDWRRIHVPFGVAYGSNPEKVRDVVLEAAKKVPFTSEDSEHITQVRFTEFGDNSLNFELVVWIRQSQVRKALIGIKSEYYYAIYKALVEAGIEIPFPQRDIHFKSLSPQILEALNEILKKNSN
ncbi:mechanosensitive ion channel family protein [Thermodesulfobacterium hydrogeniphilum]|uniref:mechanosensitive ion channel family protein n=1 Tax=Thermodesulfobacterium hydrogeniphilum TaxID=161156 RepID=UPI00057126BE|nr:mechanosensitive ion channel domain-containing protein [Thermodesulfobacterium hydrogeniphilum]